jgi:hypothetical protein
MKKLALIFLMAVSSTHAQQAAVQPADIPLAVIAPIVFVVVSVASITGQQVPLCDWLGGKYVPAPQGVNVCPGGQWAVALGLAQPR